MKLELTTSEIKGLEKVGVFGIKDLGDILDILPQTFKDKDGYINTLHITRLVATGFEDSYEAGEDYWDARYCGYHQTIYDNDNNLRSALVRLVIKMRKEGYIESIIKK